jgi:hypothetical protein
MKVKELKEYLESVDDDFDVIIGATKTIPENERGTEGYAAYPTKHFRFIPKQGDIGYMSKIIRLDINLDNEFE